MKKLNQQVGFMGQHIKKIPVNNAQYGGTILGFVLGLGAGLGIAFVIAFYLSKNTPQERPGVRAPNLPLTIRPAAAPAEGESAAPSEQLDLNKPLQGKSPSVAAPDPIGDLVNGKKPADSSATATPKGDAIYFLQVGAFTKRADADSQKAALAIQGIQTQLSEVTADGNTLWRVRSGPYGSVEESNPAREKLNGMGIKSTLIKASN